MKRIEITLHIESDEFVIQNIEPVSKKNMLLMDLKNEVKDETRINDGKY